VEAISEIQVAGSVMQAVTPEANASAATTNAIAAENEMP
jgi:hypothetical protein